MKRVVFVSSSGGHFTEILKLEKLFKNYEYLLVTEKTEITDGYKDKYHMQFLKYGPNKNKLKYIWTILYNIIKCISIIIKFKPETIVTTGAQVGGIMCFLGKIAKKRIIYIESLAKIDSLSVTGKMVYKFADKFYVQWESLVKKYEKAEYIGRLM
ncbi:MAG: polysaccharide biosynthesis protein [Clostridia bacterium]|nr:polysaccharide biosynthesis protein [Clostridia bacterium]